MKPTSELISVIVPVYQEEETVVAAVTRLFHELTQNFPMFEVIVVADGCTDGTVDQLRTLDLAELQVIEYSPNVGKGHALKVGFAASSGTIVCFIDGDLDIHPKSLVWLIDLFSRRDVASVVGSKGHQDSRVSYPRGRRLQSSMFKILVRSLFKMNVRDTQTGVKVFSRNVLEEELPKVSADGFAFDLELLARIARNHTVIEGPVELDYQFTSSIGLLVPLAMFLEILRIRVDLWRE